MKNKNLILCIKAPRKYVKSYDDKESYLKFECAWPREPNAFLFPPLWVRDLSPLDPQWSVLGSKLGDGSMRHGGLGMSSEGSSVRNLVLDGPALGVID